MNLYQRGKSRHHGRETRKLVDGEAPICDVHLGTNRSPLIFGNDHNSMYVQQTFIYIIIAWSLSSTRFIVIELDKIY